jgi:hypothetical protein
MNQPPCAICPFRIKRIAYNIVKEFSRGIKYFIEKEIDMVKSGLNTAFLLQYRNKSLPVKTVHSFASRLKRGVC